MTRPFARKLPAHCGTFNYARILQKGSEETCNAR